MALESALWQRVKRGALSLRKCGFYPHVRRIENAAGEGNPDVNGCIDGSMFDIELKSEDRPKRITTPIRFRVRESQSDWHRERAASGCRHHFILAQVGEGHNAKLYLLPGNRYDEIVAPEPALLDMSLISPSSDMSTILLRACEGY